MTRQRRLILDAVAEAGGHICIDEIYRRVQARAPGVHLVTVYRTLNFLCRLKLVTAVDAGGGLVYEIPHQSPHHHLVCLECGQLIQIEHREVAPFFAALEAQHGYTIDTDHLALFGKCPACRAASENK